ncbi:superfamily II DNA/RNA helicase [Kribbella aluminosa]|uniref:Superfamily II DNA/RNA helicase n=1 Tax=Kribbella aluminosa TaxID=416017 RepID=A0ABS4UPS0_9ACTN|nr:DEAD/DEAH box helicase [Kribbella aluminosa]MBP2353637.1 superfamily II DNA/RNA helicase [Kribbella aluminosa]
MAARRPTSTTTHNQSTPQNRKPAAAAGDPRPRRRRRSRQSATAGPEVAESNDLGTLGDDVVETVAVDNRTFAELGVPESLVAALATAGVSTPFPIQAATLPDSLAGKDVLGRGRTGSGKTYAFVLPVLARLAASGTKRRPNQPRALVLAPTRELATQIQASITPLADKLGLRSMTIFGGVGHGPQITGLRKGADIVVACPGRLEDHVQAGHAKLGAVEITVLDEADHMADLGFLPAVRRILDLTPATAQRLLFSATLDAGVDVLVRRFMTDPVTHSVDSARSPVAKMTHHVLHVRPDSRLPVLVDLTAAPGRSLVFTRTKYGAKALTKKLIAQGVPAVELHGNLSQGARTRNLEAFSDGTARTLVATDIAARGIHVDGVTLVIHADPPVEHKAYLHRSGRTARAGAEGTVVTLMTDDQVRDVRDLTRKAGITPTTTKLDPGHPLLTELAPGDRTYVTPSLKETPTNQPSTGRSSSRRSGANRSGANRGGANSAGTSRSGANRSAANGGAARAGAPRAETGRPTTGPADNGRPETAGPGRPNRRRGNRRRRATGQQAA